ncbi:MAG TPA: hypothetical protein VKV74_19115 [Bryobacteraceae bacterium]|nr:hypothetical protein [Bryobacteraceae bacterium]
MTPSWAIPRPLDREIARWRRRAQAVGAALFIVSVLGAFFNPEQFFHSYLCGFLFWWGLALGAMALVMLQYLTGGAWGVVTRRPLEAAVRTLPWLALLFAPVAAGMPYLYHWAHPELVARDPVLLHRSGYMNPPFFLIRAAIYFAVWIWWSHLLNKWSWEEDQRGDQSVRLARLSAPGLVLYVFTVTFAAIDWAQSLEDRWFSTMWGFLFVAQQGITVVCFAILCSLALARWEPMAAALPPRRFHDLGKLLLVFVMLWAYFAFSQLLIVWSGNLSGEIPWFLPRIGTTWGWLGGALIVFQFIVPFLLLLSRPLKRNAVALASVAILLLAMRWVDLFWIVMPSAHPTGFHFHWLNLTLPAAIGGFWLAIFLRTLPLRPLLPLGAPELEEALEHAHR